MADKGYTQAMKKKCENENQCHLECTRHLRMYKEGCGYIVPQKQNRRRMKRLCFVCVRVYTYEYVCVRLIVIYICYSTFAESLCSAVLGPGALLNHSISRP
jgi:hypothetical protein